MPLSMRPFWSLLLSLPLLARAAGTDPVPRLQVELEGGTVWQGRNVVQIPNEASATRFSLNDVIGGGPWPVARLQTTWNINDRHGLRLLLAPLSVTETAELQTPVTFAGSSFAAGVPTDANYKFNSWRVSYRYRFHDSERWTWWVGFTAKIRDARIRLDQGAVVAEKTDLGFVPLLHIAGNWAFAPDWTAELDADALAGGPGRAEDLSLKCRYRLDERWSLAGGYRMVEGGADVDAVYNFAWLHYSVLSVRLAL
ncbi:MAG: hypothetical protein KDC10_05730 [Calditrichaeota bacterium]|nr:hypothetical protein [Calditrichota bacterium]MCB9472347.1 hypothetical protein [Candidatus Delongbacteria bacterium]